MGLFLSPLFLLRWASYLLMAPLWVGLRLLTIPPEVLVGGQQLSPLPVMFFYVLIFTESGNDYPKLSGLFSWPTHSPLYCSPIFLFSLLTERVPECVTSAYKRTLFPRNGQKWRWDWTGMYPSSFLTIFNIIHQLHPMPVFSTGKMEIRVSTLSMVVKFKRLIQIDLITQYPASTMEAYKTDAAFYYFIHFIY